MGALVSPLPAVIPIVLGEEAGCEIKVRNSGSIVDEFTFEVLGDAASAATVTPPRLQLLPGTEGSAQLQLRLSRKCSTPAGNMPVAVKVLSKEDPQGSALGQSVLEIAPYGELTARVVPRTSQAHRSATHKLAITNQGNDAISTSLSGVDPDEVLEFDAPPGELVVQPCADASINVKVKGRKLLLRGRAKPRPFQLVVKTRGSVGTDQAAPIVADGTLVQTPLVPTWLLVALGVIVVALAVIAKTQPLSGLGLLLLAVLLIALLILVTLLLVVVGLIRRALRRRSPQ